MWKLYAVLLLQHLESSTSYTDSITTNCPLVYGQFLAMFVAEVCFYLIKKKHPIKLLTAARSPYADFSLCSFLMNNISLCFF